MLGSPVDVVREDLTAQRVASRASHRLASLRAQRCVDVVADRLLILLRDSEQHPDHSHRHLGAEVGHEVEPARTDQRIEAIDAEPPDLRLERGHLLRREHARQQPPVHGMHRRIFEDEHAGRDLDVRLDQLEDGAAPGDVRVPVEQSPLHVLVAADGEEVVLLVVIERRFLAQPAEHRIGVGVDRDVVRVVVDIARAGCRHRCLLGGRFSEPVGRISAGPR